MYIGIIVVFVGIFALSFFVEQYKKKEAKKYNFRASYASNSSESPNSHERISRREKFGRKK